MKKAGVIGFFAADQSRAGGQEVKTGTMTGELIKLCGRDAVMKVDTTNWKRNPVRLFFRIFRVMVQCRNVIILPAHNGLRVIAPLLYALNRLFHRRLHYVVIGGWLPKFAAARPRLASILRRFDWIYVETETMRRCLMAQGFDNVVRMPNCKTLTPLRESELTAPEGEPYRLCTFSRVMREKGIEEAVQAVCAVNERAGRTVYTLDIYGQVEERQTAWFAALEKSFPTYIRYGGVIPPEESVETLRPYFALLFPTKFYTEGVPGTILDAYGAGIPVIASRWESFADVVDEGRTGLGYDFGTPEALTELLAKLAETPERITTLKKACLDRAKAYQPDRVMEILTERLS